MVSQMLAEPTHGLVSQLSRTQGVSRQTLYRWAETGRRALAEALGSHAQVSKQLPSLHSLVLTLLIETHASYRGIQSCLKSLHGKDVSLGNIASIVKEAGQRAQRWLEHQQAETARPLALDEQYGGKRGKAYLNVIDVHSGQVWASVPLVEVDGDSWTLVLWMLQDQGIETSCLVSDGGRAILDGVSQGGKESSHQRDVWHVLHFAGQVLGRLDRVVEAERERLPALARQAERQAGGKRPRGRPAATTFEQQRALVARLSSVAEDVRYLCQELHTLLEVVVPRSDHLLDSQQRQGEIETLLCLLEEVAPRGTTGMQEHIQKLGKQIRLALPHLLWFARQLDAIQHQTTQELSPPVVAFLGWAWLRRKLLASHPEELLLGLAPAWREGAQGLFSAWEQAVRASSAVENWHSVLRPHLAAHRKLSAGLLALLAVWHNHLVAPRGLHEGLSPLQRTGSTASTVHWLAALGYSPMAA